MLIISCFCTYNYNTVSYNLVPRAMPVRGLGRHWLWGNIIFPVIGLSVVHADKEQEPLNVGVPVVYFPRANAFLVSAQALLWVRDWSCYASF
jgi:hypothetical protein